MIEENLSDKNRETSRKKESDKLSRNSTLSLISGTMIILNSALLGVAVKWFPWIIPVLPGTDNNASIPLNELVVVGLVLGGIVLFGAAMLYYRPENRRLWGVIVAAFSLPSVLTGGGFVLGFILGIVGGLRAFSLRDG